MLGQPKSYASGTTFLSVPHVEQCQPYSRIRSDNAFRVGDYIPTGLDHPNCGAILRDLLLDGSPTRDFSMVTFMEGFTSYAMSCLGGPLTPIELGYEVFTSFVVGKEYALKAKE